MWIHLLSLGLIDGAGGEAVAPKAAGGGYGGGKKKKYIVRRGANLFVYSSAAAAANALNEEEEEKQEAIAEVEEVAEIAAEIEQPAQISLPAVRAYAKTTGQIQQYSAAYKSEHWDKLIAMFEDMREEEEVEMLLLTA